MEKQIGIENWKLMDYAYCPQIVQELIEQGIHIQDTHNALMIRLQPLFEWKQVLKLMNIIDDHKEEIKAVHGHYAFEALHELIDGAALVGGKP